MQPASELYAGEHWSCALALPASAKRSGFDPKLWVLSAGYGLIPAGAPVKPYGATFSTGHRDSVGRTAEECRQWWAALADWRGPESDDDGPRSVRQLAANEPESCILVVASQGYLRALETDLLAAEARAGSRFAVVSAGAKRGSSALGPCLLPSDARLQREVGGTRGALNCRIADRLLQMTTPEAFTHPRLTELAEAWLERQPALTRYKRTPLQDADVLRFIASALQANPKAARSPLLRQLRDDGFACEQSRFRTLFNQAIEVRNGQI